MSKREVTAVVVYQPTDIERLERCKGELLRCKDLKTVLEIRDRAAAIKNYLKAKEEAWESQITASSIIALSEARVGQLLREGQKEGTIATGGRPQKRSQDGTVMEIPQTLDNFGIPKNASSRFQMAADVLDNDPEWFERHAEECKEKRIDFTQKSVIRRARKIRNAETSGQSPSKVEGEYDVIVIDPPWDTTRIDMDERIGTDAGFDYPTMTEEELEVLDIPHAENCHVWVWTTHRFLPMALRLVAAWGMKYTCTFVWVKSKGMQPIGLPYYNCEFALYCRVGDPEFKTTKGLKTAYSWERKGLKHSEKPPEFYEEVVRVTEGKRLDMFNRREIPGFERWGNEVQKETPGE